ncbi:RNA helicase [Corynebacterium sp. 13CS0277]|uniref:DEAD/DEAH box helicase n=1 Tax=Corynebacterium sp. 13CS0277 TaxID=2071994 RepID=UPI000D027ADC|nr:DEAD/DEAH box helicase [Corynebacterium sp. 13CS0277]PRQ12031.1 RNA helicase [Corynebacterium sp. 13CS0277]
MTTFRDLGLPEEICRELRSQGITEPFPIQAEAIPAALAGRDVLGRGPTGSGKTFTFGLPMLARLAASGASRPGRPRGVVLVPTRELAAQVSQRLADPAAALGLRVLEVVGGVNIKRNITSLAAPVDLLVATPGRAQDLLNQKILSFAAVEVCALDEADQMADMGFLPQVRRLLQAMPRDGQRLLFSATLDGDITTLVDEFMDDPVTFSTAPAQATVDRMEHYLLHVADRPSRFAVVERIAAREGTTIMFMRTKHAVDRQVKKLRRAGINAAGLHGDKGQGARTRAIEGFQNGDVPVLVATDIAARGIDVAGVDLVVHIDPPAEHKAYVHRAGRTARAGAGGTVVTLVMPEQTKDVEALCRAAGISPAEYEVDADSAILGELMGARHASGPALAPFGAPAGTPAAGSGRGQGSKTRGQRRSRDSRSADREAAGSSPGRGRGRARRAEESSATQSPRGRRRNTSAQPPAQAPEQQASSTPRGRRRTKPVQVRADGSAVGDKHGTRPRRRRRF